MHKHVAYKGVKETISPTGSLWWNESSGIWEGSQRLTLWGVVDQDQSRTCCFLSGNGVLCNTRNLEKLKDKKYFLKKSNMGTNW